METFNHAFFLFYNVPGFKNKNFMYSLSKLVLENKESKYKILIIYVRKRKTNVCLCSCVRALHKTN